MNQVVLYIYDQAAYVPGACEIVKLAGAGEDDDSDLSIAQDREFLGFLQQSIPPLRKRNLPARWIVDPSYHNLSPSHLSPPKSI